MSGDLRILMVEDSESDAALVERELRKAGFQFVAKRVDTSRSLHEALANWTPDLVLSDFTIPSFDGLAALEIVRQKNLDVPFIFVSGTIGEERAVEALKRGATDYVVKDRLSRLGYAVTRALREKKDRDEHKLVTQNLRDIEARQRMVLQSFPIAIYSRNARRFTWVSDNIAGLSGFPAKQYTDLPEFWESRIHPEQAAAVKQNFEELSFRDSIVTEYRWCDATGKYRWILDQAVIVRDSGEIIGTWLDVSERKTLEDQLRQAQKMEAVGRLAGGIAHDFNNLLTAIIGYSEMVLDKMDPNNAVRTDLTEIHAAGKRAAELTRQLLAFSRRQLLQPRIIDLNGIVSGLEKMLRRLIGEDIELLTRLDPALDRTKVDPGQIEQVIMNLAVNARDAMPEGGKLILETSNVRLDQAESTRHWVMPAGNYVMLAVTDTGSGMDAATQAHLFEPFFTTKPQGKGTGLGLPTVYGIVKQSDGFIWCNSEVGKGTTFKVYFRPASGAPQPADAPIQVANLRGTETVLVVEDDPGVRILTHRILEKQGYSILEASDGFEALQLAGETDGPIHLVVTDVVMPGMSGPELVERLLRARPNLRAIYLSGYTDDATMRLTMVKPGFSFLQKPYTAQALGQRVREVLDYKEK